MVKCIYSPDGRCVAYAVAEITAVPYYELLNKDPSRALTQNQLFFIQQTTGLLRLAERETTAFEILFQSVPVDNQTYAAQVKIFFIVRRMGTDPAELTSFVEAVSSGIKHELEEQNYVVRFFETDADYDRFLSALSGVDCSSVKAVAKKEKALGNMLFENGSMYFNQALHPNDCISSTILTNALTYYPNSAVSLQIIPTAYTEAERISVTQGRGIVGYYIGELRRQQGMMPLDSNTQSLADAFDYYCAAASEPTVYANLLVYSSGAGCTPLANKLISLIEDESADSAQALETVDLSGRGLSPANAFPVSPWINSNLLVYEERAGNPFWTGKKAPTHLMRLRYLLTVNELKTAFKIPFDDGTAIGLETKRILTNRETLGKGIISEKNFKIGVIQNSSGGQNSAPVHAGIPLNDFTKHGLIVGTPGSGKTNFSLGFLLQMWNGFGIPFLAIEPTKSEYRSLVDSIPDLQIFTPGKSGVSPYIINPFIPPTGVTVESYVPSLMTAFKAAFSMPDPLPDIFLAAINECYNEYGWRMDSTKDSENIRLFGMYEFIKVFKRRIRNMDYKGDVKANMESAGTVRLVSLIEQNSFIYDTIHTIPLEDLLSKPTVIELNAINNKEQKSLIMALLLILICVYTKNNVAGDGKLKNILLIDEAHVLLGGRSGPAQEGAPDSSGTTIEAVEDMIAEIRSYGTSIVIADQSPAKVGKNIVANTNVKVIFRLVEKENKDIIRNATNMTDADYDRLGRLGVGEAMLHYGRVYEPLHIKTYNVNERASIRPVIEDAEIHRLSHYWDTRQDLLIPHRECAYNPPCKNDCDFKVRAFADFVAARLLNQFRADVNDLASLCKVMVRLNAPINAVMRETPGAAPSVRLYNCIKIKFLRKVLLAKSIEVSHSSYETLLTHPNVLDHSDPGTENKG